MRYIDKDGDTWEDAEPGSLRIVQAKDKCDVGLTVRLERAEEMYGPFTPLPDHDEPQNDPSDALPRVTDVMGRADVFQAAHALVKGLEWGDEKPSVYDVLNVAKWLEGEG
ncbi:hypothetical protein [Streptomyces sennicomposti]